jgi:hypothetical protein
VCGAELRDFALETISTLTVTPFKSTSTLIKRQHILFLMCSTETVSATRIAKFWKLIATLVIAALRIDIYHFGRLMRQTESPLPIREIKCSRLNTPLMFARGEKQVHHLSSPVLCTVSSFFSLYIIIGLATTTIDNTSLHFHIDHLCSLVLCTESSAATRDVKHSI